MKTYVLVHGAFASKYAWDLVTPLLEKDGHKVVALDLPAHGDDGTPVSDATFENYVNTVVENINMQENKVVLVGHSMGGMVISAVAEKYPHKISDLVYLSAYVPHNGQSLQDMAEKDSESLIGKNLQFAPDYSTGSLPDEVIIQVFAADCTDEVKELLMKKNRPEPLAPFQAKVTLTDANYGSVNKYYIETLKDEGVGNKLQKEMVAANGQFKNVYSINSSHSPYFAQPAELASILKNIG